MQAENYKTLHRKLS